MCSFEIWHSILSLCSSLLKSTSPVLVRFFLLLRCNFWASLWGWWWWWGAIMKNHGAWKWTQPFSKNHQEPERQPWAHSPHPLSQHSQSTLSSFFLVHLLWSLPSVDYLILFCLYALSSSFCFCFLMANPSKIQLHLLSLCLLAPISTANYLILSLVSLHWHHS